MATVASSLPPAEQRERGFFLWMSLALAAIISFAFVQWTVRGYVDPWTAPIWLHLHGLAMVGWLALLVTQSFLARTGRQSLHRAFGWSALFLLLAIGVLGILTGIYAVEQHRVPPFWSNAFLLGLAFVQVIAFEGLVLAAILLRRRTEWHRRLMLGATIVLLKAALDRLLPLPLLGAAGPWVEACAQLAAVAVLAGHDLAHRGRIHPATLWIACVVLATHVVMAGLAGFAPFVAFADRLAG